METETKEPKKGVSPAVASGAICFVLGVVVGILLSMFKDWNWYTPFGPGPASAGAQDPVPSQNIKGVAKDVTAEKLSKDFADDADKAQKDYEKKPIILTGVVEKIDPDRKEIQLATGDAKIAVVLSVKELVVPDPGTKYHLMKQAGGKLATFGGKTVVIEFDRVDLKPMADKNKADQDK